MKHIYNNTYSTSKSARKQLYTVSLLSSWLFPDVSECATLLQLLTRTKCATWEMGFCIKGDLAFGRSPCVGLYIKQQKAISPVDISSALTEHKENIVRWKVTVEIFRGKHLDGGCLPYGYDIHGGKHNTFSIKRKRDRKKEKKGRKKDRKGKSWLTVAGFVNLAEISVNLH